MRSQIRSEHKRKLLVICPYPEGVAAGQRLKYEQYFDHWRAAGYELTVSPFMDSSMWKIVHKSGYTSRKVFGMFRGLFRTWRMMLTIPRYDGVYLHMYVVPLGSSLPERIVRLLARKIIYDLEDNVTLGQKSSVNPLSALLRGTSKFDYMIRKADHVITSAPSLNDHCLGINEKKACTYISSSMDTQRFNVVNTYTNDKKPVIGWTGTFSSRVFLDLLRPVFLALKKERDFKLLVIGNFDYEFPEMDLEVIQWTSEKEVADLQRMDIGVYPLPDNDWVTGKSGLKAIQYMTIGIPAVATNVGNTPTFISHMENGCLVNTEEEWVEILKTLIDDPELRKKVGMAGRETAVARFSKEAIQHQYLNILNNTIC